MGSGVSVIKQNSESDNSLENNIINCSHFLFGHILGHGGFALVRHGLHKKTKRQYAIKEILLEKIYQQNNNIDVLLYELNALQSFGEHPFLIKLHYAFREDNSFYIVTDSLIGGDLRLHLRNFESFSELQIAYFALCIGSALNHLHQRNIIHRDIKPENIILDSKGIPYLADFGISCIFSLKTIPICELSSGTLPYLSPESITYGHKHSFQADFWSLGITCYELWYAKRPYEKHCPKTFIYFSDNYYRLLWEKVASIEPQNIMWKNLYNEISIDDIKNNLNYPQHFIPLLPNGDLPIELRTPIPISDCHEDRTRQLSYEGKLFIGSLLDIRIEKRLGSPDNIQQFYNHPWFINNHLKIENIYKSKSPFIPNVKSVQERISRKYRDPSLLQGFQKSNTPLIFTPEIEQQLIQSTYISPKDLQSNRKNTKSLPTEASITVGISIYKDSR